MRRWNGWSNEVIGVRQDGQTGACHTLKGALSHPFPDCCMSAVRVVQP